VQLPRAFIEKAQSWKTDPPKKNDAEALTEMVDVSEQGPPGMSGPKFARLPTFDRIPAHRPQSTALRALALVIAAAVVGFAGVSIAVRLRKSALEVTSTPPGAALSIDGKDTGKKTPTVLDDLPGAKTYKVQLTKDGFTPWKNDVPLQRGQHLVVAATLEALPPPPPPKVEPPPVVDAGTPEPAPPPPDEVAWPTSRFELDATRHRLDLSQAGALAVTLDPAQTYRVTLGKGAMEGWGFYVVNDAGAQPGAFTPQPLQMKGVTKLFAFHFPASALGAEGKDDTKPRPLAVQAGTEKRVTTYKVPGTLKFPETARVTVKALDPDDTYELLVRQGEPAARVRRSGAEERRVLVGHPTQGLVVVSLDEPWRFTGASSVWLTLLDDASGTEEGRLAFELREVKAKKKKKR
jgi:hypothetical protein